MEPQQPEDEIRSCDLVQQTCLQFEKDFGLVRTASPDLLTTYQLLRDRIVQVIQEMLTHDPKRLINLMYRLDIDERKFRQALFGGEGDPVAEQIADLVLEREKQKVYWRNKYRKL